MEYPICGGEEESEAILKKVLKQYVLSGLVIAGFVLCTSCQVEERTYSPKKVASKPTATLPQQEPDYDYQVRIHPDDSLYIGDVISFEVLAPEGEEIEGQEVEIGVAGDVPLSFGPIAFSDFGIGEHRQATFQWVWDTSGLPPGEYLVNFSVMPGEIEWSQNIILQSADERPLEEQDATLEQITIECCVIHYISGTESEEELEEIVEISEKAAVEISSQMDFTPVDQMQLVLIPRVMGHGGFAYGEVYLSYLERNYAADDFNQVMEHELVHVLDNAQGGDLLPTFLREGLAVHLSGGHYKPEALMPRAAALMDLGWYLPLIPLADDFYSQQHEIGYLEAGAFVGYMIERWGYKAFDDFYRDIHLPESGSHAEAIDIAMQAHFGLTFAECEQSFLTRLHDIEINPDIREDLRLTVLYFDTVRRYQQLLDPSAYYLQAWLVTWEQLEEHNALADYLRHPEQAENLTLETLLVSAQDKIQYGQYQEAERFLAAINQALDQLEQGKTGAMQSDPLVRDYHDIVMLSLARGYEPQHIEINGNEATVNAMDELGEDITFVLVRMWNIWWMQ